MCMNITNASGILVKGNINKRFFWYCLKRQPKLILFIFINLYYRIISILINNKAFYESRKFRYYGKIKNFDDVIDSFGKTVKKINYFNIKYDYIVEKSPSILLKSIFPRVRIIGYEFNKKYIVALETYEKNVKDLYDINNLYINEKYKIYFNSLNIKNKYIVRHRRLYLKRQTKHHIKLPINIIMIFLMANLITIMSFFFTNANLDLELFKTYFEIRVYIMNFIPIFAVMLGLYIISGRVYIAFAVTFITTLALGISNQTKLTYRDDIVKFEDLLIIKEALIMSEKYAIVVKKYTIIFILLFIPSILILRNRLRVFKLKWYFRLFAIIPITLTLFLGYKYFYSQEDIYSKLGDKSIINIWIATRQYQIRGMIYPFVYTIKDVVSTIPEGYTLEKAENILKSYTYESIPEDKKVNIIAIMFEAFNDFSKFKEIEFKTDIYKKFHSIQNESISGTIVTQIFGGGTIVSERNFLTGYYRFPTFRKSTNSYVWYFKEQGYNTDAMHPAYGAFYNRTSANTNLGFDNYYNCSNRYNLIQEEIMWDDHYFLDDIISQYEQNKKTNKPYFNFSVTYQNHGPYTSDKYDGKPYYIKKKNMSDEGYNTINEYFKGIYDTVDAMYQLIEYFKKESEPTIVITFGDHNPYLGENQLAYNELGINMDLSTVEGFRNYYSTPYIIYGNPSAKKLFNKTFVGKGNEISPIFLMNELFDYIGLKGNEYMQYMSDLKKQKTVMGTVYEKENGKYISAEEATSNKEYEIVSYYVANNFKLQK